MAGVALTKDSDFFWGGKESLKSEYYNKSSWHAVNFWQLGDNYCH